MSQALNSMIQLFLRRTLVLSDYTAAKAYNLNSK